jgi:hypothetical protein
MRWETSATLTPTRPNRHGLFSNGQGSGARHRTMS